MTKFYCKNCNFRTIRQLKYNLHIASCKNEINILISSKFPNKKIYFLTYGDNNYKNSKNRLYNEAINSNFFTDCFKLGPDNLNNDFKDKFKDVLKLKKGAGYWIWKPYIIYNKLLELNNNDFLIYMDAGCKINLNGKKKYIKYLKMLEDSNEGIISFETIHKEKYFTNKYLLDFLNVDINSKMANSNQLVGGILILKKNENTIKIFSETLDILNKDPYLFTDKYNEINKIKKFKCHRHDQSILSIIRKQNKSIILKDETYFKEFFKNESINYPFFATRIKG